MKKALSLVLAILVAFSMFAVVAAAEGEEATADTVTVKFIVDGIVYEELTVAAGVTLTPLTPENPEKQNTDTMEYTFKGWESSLDGKLYYKGTIPDASEDVTYTAVFSEKEITENQSFWNLVESIFERINKIFEYFAIIFNW